MKVICLIGSFFMELKKEIDLIQRNKDAYQRGAFFWINLANQRLGDFNKQLLAFAVVLLPLTASIILSRIDLNTFEKTLLVISWVFLGISILAGLIQILIDQDYFKKLSRDSSKREEIWSDLFRPIADLEKDTRALAKVNESSTHDPIKIQAIFLFIGLLLIMISAGSILLAS